MTRGDERTADAAGVETTRRDALRSVGGVALAALATTAFGGRVVVAAQEASPAAGDGLEGRYAVVRLRSLKPDRTAAEVMDLIREGYLPLARAVPGFVSYVGVADPGSRDTVFIGVFADKAGADESTRLAGDWLTENGYDFFAGEPTVVEGVIDIAAEVGV